MVKDMFWEINLVTVFEYVKNRDMRRLMTLFII